LPITLESKTKVMKTKLNAFLLPVILGLAACDSPKEEVRDEREGAAVRIEDRKTIPERDTVFIGVENKEEEKRGVEIRVEEGGDFEIKRKRGN
jgi:hypothetical protein